MIALQTLIAFGAIPALVAAVVVAVSVSTKQLQQRKRK